MATEVIAKARVSRALPQPDVDGARDGEPLRGGRYDELYALTPGKRNHVLADEGSYYVANNSGTGSPRRPPPRRSATRPRS
jgi:hypothetical protein